jgi:hypothetical protein
MNGGAVPHTNGPEDVTIWRYMDLPRFVWMLSTARLWFAKAASFKDDPWEGFGTATRFAVANDAPKVDKHETVDAKTRLISVPEMMADMSRRSADILENARGHLYINSWCLDPLESMAMWEIYGSRGLGVALQSTVEQFQRAAKFEIDSSHYAFGKVTYHDALESAAGIHFDFSTNIPLPGAGLRCEVLKLGLHKRSCYSYESEWRAVLYQDPRPDIAGVGEVFDLDQLISAVYVGPRAEGFIVEAVSSVMDRFVLRKPLKKSDLLGPPR